MKKASLALVIGATLLVSACGSDDKTEKEAQAETPATQSEYATEAQQNSYAMGAAMANFAKDRFEQAEEAGIEVDYTALEAGFTDILAGTSAFSEEEIKNLNIAADQKFRAAQEAKLAAASATSKADGEAFLAANKDKEGVVTTESGLQYMVIQEGNGASPAAADTVSVHYEGTLTDGTVFDSSIERGTPASFPLNRVISGWTEGLQLMQVGAKYRFFIPSELGYGSRAAGKIPAHSALIFDVELLEVTPATPAE
ncbi:FKBP-type peptidyl-prolyl cis-trans isomerase [Glaciecola petra]|uniref:Peptidyl-prolyl cis-trans isomerase n=1 Tax=Glaciecola petra TaxID=3075602 RepID=A0ABU2ZR89_9ALTE|nr:FKBP-type peptidyl-prolyl cis-trans isomerase [Aestuariibacter sp. P117]MDT0595156.1 FKBP-type peptidyl-prolyl cis-trans isomerase [Aestuariibacter sp. P117]